MTAVILAFRPRRPIPAYDDAMSLANVTLGLASGMTAAWLAGWFVVARVVAAAMRDEIEAAGRWS